MVHLLKNKRGDIFKYTFKKGITFNQFKNAIEGKNIEHPEKVYEQVTGKKVADEPRAITDEPEKVKSGKDSK